MANTYLFLGDSITCANRLWLPDSDGLGNGFVSFLANKIRTITSDAQFINKGHDGFTVPFLLKRLTYDTLQCNPDYVTILIGINDVGITMNTGVSLETQRFETSYDTLLKEIMDRTNAHILCAGPFIFPCPQEYINWILQVKKAECLISALAKKYNLAFIPLHDVLNQAAEKEGYDRITTDGIHLTAHGHQILTDILFPYFKQTGMD